MIRLRTVLDGIAFALLRVSVEPLDVAARLLEAVPRDLYCAACLASALQVPILSARDIIGKLAIRDDYQRLEGLCSGCGGVGLSVTFVPWSGTGSDAAPRRVKCARCSRAVGEADLVTEQGDDFHRQCLQILRSNAKVADSRQASRLSYELIRRSLERMDKRPNS